MMKIKAILPWFILFIFLYALNNEKYLQNGHNNPVYWALGVRTFFYMRQYNLFQLVKISGSNQFAQSHVYEYPISSYIRKFGLSIQYRQDGLIVQFIKRRIFGENIFCTF